MQYQHLCNSLWAKQQTDPMGSLCNCIARAAVSSFVNSTNAYTTNTTVKLLIRRAADTTFLEDTI
jgi:hypothetical protein